MERSVNKKENDYQSSKESGKNSVVGPSRDWRAVNAPQQTSKIAGESSPAFHGFKPSEVNCGNKTSPTKRRRLVRKYQWT